MPSDLSRRAVLSLVLLAALTGAAAWSYFDQLKAASGLDADQDNLVACQQAAAKIEQLRQRKQRALLRSKPSDELNRKVDAWAREVGIDAERLARIEPQEPRRVGDTQYLEQVTELEILAVPLEELVRLAQLAESSEEGLKLTSLRVSPPRSARTAESQVETWNAELELTYLIYAPKRGTR